MTTAPAAGEAVGESPAARGQATVSGFNVDPAAPYDGPEFEEYCIQERAYLAANRDRSACLVCPLGDLCDAGFKEQVRLVTAGENPSLTDCKIFPDEVLEKDVLVQGLTDVQRTFVLQNVFGETQGEK